ncbi:hypothetical protein QZH41_007575, partial [Actinostola sp. cb2023]
MKVATNNNILSEDFACASELFVTSCNNSGMASMILMTLDHISLCRKVRATPTVFWRNCHTVCPRDATINAWEMFFQPVNPNIEEKAKKVLCLGNDVGPEDLWAAKLNLVKANSSLFKNRPIGNLISLGFRQRNAYGFKGEAVITRDIRMKANGLLQEYVKVTPKIQMMVDQFYSKHLSKYNVLAVHVVYTKAFRTTKYDGRAVHASGADPYMIGSQVLVDILVMAKCKHFLHAESSVAALVAYFNPDIESHFLSYDRKDVWVQIDTTLEEIKNVLWKEARDVPLFDLLRDRTSYVFVCVNLQGKMEELVDETRQLLDVRPFRPILKLIERIGDSEVKLLDSNIGLLLGKSLHELEQMQNPEVDQFRHRYRRLVEGISRERSFLDWESRAMYSYPPDVHVDNEELTPAFVEKNLLDNRRLKISIAMIRNNKTGLLKDIHAFNVHVDSFPAEVLTTVLEKRAAIMGVECLDNHEDYILKIIGRESYLLGGYPLIQYQ